MPDNFCSCTSSSPLSLLTACYSVSSSIESESEPSSDISIILMLFSSTYTLLRSGSMSFFLKVVPYGDVFNKLDLAENGLSLFHAT